MSNNIAITVDLDWAPDFTIEYLMNIFLKKNIKVTWLLTHTSPIIEKLFNYPDLFDIGIHPNFMPNSTHGNSYVEVMKHMMKLVPNAKIVRTHGLFQSSNILKMMCLEFGLEIDLSIFLWDTEFIQSHTINYGKTAKLKRIPYFWAEEEEMNKENNFDLKKVLNKEGLKIFNFHPIHVYLNSYNISQYEDLKKNITYPNCNEIQIEKFINTNNIGVKDFLLKLINTNNKICRITEIDSGR